MSLASNLSYVDQLSETVVFDETTRDATGTVRIDTGRSLSAPRTLTIRHTMASAKASPQVDRHLVSIQQTDTGADGKPRTATVNLSFVVPRDMPGDVTAILRNIEGLIHSIYYDNTAALLRGES